MSSIVPVILAGGFGTRLWPSSRKSYPKQFSSILGQHSLFQKTATRLISSSAVQFNQPIVVTNEDFRFIVSEQLKNVGINPGSIIIEPDSKNTAPSILAASIYAFKKNKDATLLVAPSDHIIENTKAFHDAIKTGFLQIKEGKMITFGVHPTHAETGYGYLKCKNSSLKGIFEIERFVEKPDKNIAQKMLEKKNYLWNAGIFLFRAVDMIDAFKLYAENLVGFVNTAVENGKSDLEFLRLEPGSWDKCDKISIDYAIMEKATNLAAVPFSAGWSDLGDWNAVWKEMRPDEHEVSLSQNAHAIDCQNTLLRSENDDQQIIGLGLENIVAIAMKDSVLVANKERTQDVKKVVEKLKVENAKQAEIFPKDHRPWGWFESLAISDRFQVKRICVHPSASLSLQSHNHRSEHWIVVEGTAKVTVGEEIHLITEGQSIYVPLGAKHRLENPGKIPIILIEVQTGAYLGEDDIVRYEDIYSRT